MTLYTKATSNLNKLQKFLARFFGRKLTVFLKPEILAQKFSFGIWEPAKLGAAYAAKILKIYQKPRRIFVEILR